MWKNIFIYIHINFIQILFFHFYNFTQYLCYVIYVLLIRVLISLTGCYQTLWNQLYRLDLSECSEINYEFYEDVKVFISWNLIIPTWNERTYIYISCSTEEYP